MFRTRARKSFLSRPGSQFEFTKKKATRTYIAGITSYYPVGLCGQTKSATEMARQATQPYSSAFQGSTRRFRAFKMLPVITLEKESCYSLNHRLIPPSPPRPDSAARRGGASSHRRPLLCRGMIHRSSRNQRVSSKKDDHSAIHRVPLKTAGPCAARAFRARS